MSSDEDSPDNDDYDLARLIEENSRPWQGYWYWRDKPVAERDAAYTVLSEAGFDISDLRSRTDGEDPPDCEAIVNGLRCGIEVTELLHKPTLEQSIQAKRARKAGREPAAGEAYFVWEREDLVAEIQRLIARKDKAKPKGGPYARYFLVIVTDETYLDRFSVADFLQGATFQAGLITDVLLGLSYHPSSELDGGSCPIFNLQVTRHTDTTTQQEED